MRNSKETLLKEQKALIYSIIFLVAAPFITVIGGLVVQVLWNDLAFLPPISLREGIIIDLLITFTTTKSKDLMGEKPDLNRLATSALFFPGFILFLRLMVNMFLG